MNISLFILSAKAKQNRPGRKAETLFKTSESSRRDPGPAGTARVTNFTPHAGSGTCRAPTCEHATLCSHPMRRQLRQRAVVGKPGRRTARPKFGNTELSAQPTVASNGGQEHATPTNCITDAPWRQGALGCFASLATTVLPRSTRGIF